MADEMSMGDRMPGMVEDIKARMKEMVTTAEKEGKLDKLMQVVKKLGLSTDAKALFVAAQGYDKTRGISPDELASEIEKDPKMVDIIISIAAPGEEAEAEGEGPAETAAEGGVEEPTGEAAVKEKMKKMKKSAMAMDQEEEDMADEEAAKAYKSKLMM
jgi:hypothetical protein